MKKLSGLEWTVMVLTIVGAINWGLMAINPGWNIITKVFGDVTSTIAKLFLGLIGLSGIYLIYWLSQ